MSSRPKSRKKNKRKKSEKKSTDQSQAKAKKAQQKPVTEKEQPSKEQKAKVQKEVVEKATPETQTQGAEAKGDTPEQKDGEHLLETAWTLYYDKKMDHGGRKGTGGKGFKQYESNLRPLGTFNTLEGFWKLHSWIKPADSFPRDHNLLLFRKGYLPAWETFPQGGMWIIKVRKGNGVVARLWEELCFAAIGELFAEPDVCGVMISSRAKSDNLSVWNKDGYNDEVRFKIGEKMRELLNLDESTLVEYKYFNQAIRDGSSFRNAKPYAFYAVPAMSVMPGSSTPAASS